MQSGADCGQSARHLPRTTPRRLRRELGDTVPLSQVTAERAAAVFAAAWDGAAARTWNRHRSALRSFTTWAAGPGRGWITGDPAALIDRRPETQDRTRVIDRHLVTAILDRRGVALRDKTLWQLLYESAARADSVLVLNIEDLDPGNKRGRITAKGGIIRWVQWQSGTARLLPTLTAGRTRGPLFLAERRPAPARTPAAADLCPTTGRGRLSYERAEYLFKQATKKIDPAGKGYTLHQLRHSRLTHLGSGYGDHQFG
jgi:site-specific recombinase XerD